MTPTGRSLAFMRQLGFIAAPVERYIPELQQSRDVWRFGDILCAHPANRQIVIVQATSLPNLPARKRKALQQPELTAWLAAGGRFELHGWVNKDGHWSVSRIEITEGLQPIHLAFPKRKKRRPAFAAAELF